MNTWILMFFATSNLLARLLHSQISTFNLLSAMLASLLSTECKNKIPVVLHYIIASVVILGMFGWSDELPIWSGLKYLNNGIPSYTCTVCYTTNSHEPYLYEQVSMQSSAWSKKHCCTYNITMPLCSGRLFYTVILFHLYISSISSLFLSSITLIIHCGTVISIISTVLAPLPCVKYDLVL